MMYHIFGARTYRYLTTKFKGGAAYHHLEKKERSRCCAECRSRDITFDSVNEVTVKTVPCGFKETFLVLHLRVLQCRSCGAKRQESRDVAQPRKSYTRMFANYVLGLVKQMTIKAVAQHLRVGWDLVKEILKGSLERKARRRSWRKVRRIAIDEIAIRKGHDYMTVVYDLDTGQVLYGAEGKGKKSLEPFFRRLRRARAKLEAVAMDMSEAYVKAVEEYWPRPVAIVHDHYHLVANMNEVITNVRRLEQNRLAGEDKLTLKGSRYLLLYARERLEKEKPEKIPRLEALLAANETLHKVYLLKEDLRLFFWGQESKDQARTFIKNWVAQAKALNVKPLTTFAETVESRIEHIISWYDHPITTGPLEGINNKIKVLKRVAYGYRDIEFFVLRLLFLHETKLNLAGA
jgi:transposase